MKKIYILSLALMMAVAVSAQVSVTFKVDVTNYAAAEEIKAEGMRIGGNFTTVGGTLADETAVPDWSPSNAACAMTDEGDGMWSITIVYPETAIGTEQLFKFVNGDWGTNEGGGTSAIASGGCGVDDGGGNINRTFEIPSNNVTLSYCYDSCKTCSGADPILSVASPVNVTNMTVYPNPTTNNATFSYTLNKSERVTISIYNLLGEEVSTVFSGNLNAGTYSVETSIANLESGIYIYKMQVGASSTQGQIVKQ